MSDGSAVWVTGPRRDKAEKLMHNTGELVPLLGHSLLSAGVFQGVLFATQVRALTRASALALSSHSNMKESSPEPSTLYADTYLYHDAMRMQRAGMLVKVSASGPWGLGHVMGAAGVGVASVCTGQAAVAFDEWRCVPLSPFVPCSGLLRLSLRPTPRWRRPDRSSTGRSPAIVRELQRKGGMTKYLENHQREMFGDAVTGLVTFCVVSKSLTN